MLAVEQVGALLCALLCTTSISCHCCAHIQCAPCCGLPKLSGPPGSAAWLEVKRSPQTLACNLFRPVPAAGGAVCRVQQLADSVCLPARPLADVVRPSSPLCTTQLAALFAKFSGVLEEYEERRAERMQRMQSEVGVGSRTVNPPAAVRLCVRSGGCAGGAGCGSGWGHSCELAGGSCHCMALRHLASRRTRTWAPLLWQPRCRPVAGRSRGRALPYQAHFSATAQLIVYQWLN